LVSLGQPCAVWDVPFVARSALMGAGCRQAAWLEHAGVQDATAADTAASLAALRERFNDFQHQLRLAGWDPTRIVLRAGEPRLRLRPAPIGPDGVLKP